MAAAKNQSYWDWFLGLIGFDTARESKDTAKKTDTKTSGKSITTKVKETLGIDGSRESKDMTNKTTVAINNPLDPLGGIKDSIDWLIIAIVGLLAFVFLFRD